MSKLPVLGAAVAAVALAATGAAALRGDEPRSAAATPPGTWRLLPPLPDRATTDVDGLVVLGGATPTVAVVDRGRDATTPSAVSGWRWRDGRWRRVAAPLPVDRDQQVLAAGDSCLAAPAKGRATVWCLRGGAWRRVGAPIFAADQEGLARPTLSAFAAGGPAATAVRVAAVPRVGRPAVAPPAGRPQATSFVAIDDGWRAEGPVAAPEDAPGGSLRPFTFERAGSRCVVATLLGRRADRSPTVGGSCRSAAGPARVQRIPPLSVTRVAGRRAVAERVALNSDGAVGRGADALVGVDVFTGPSTSWQVWRLRGDRWRRTELVEPDAGWNSQGSLHRVGDLVLALRFDQRGALQTGLRSRIAVRGLAPDGRTGDVGGPLVDGTARAPLYWDLAAGDRDVYAAATAPNPATGRNDVRVWTTSRAALARAASRW